MIVVFHKLKRGIGKQSLTALRDAQQTDKRNQPEVTVRTNQTDYQKKIQEGVYAAQSACSIPILGNIQT